jgi:hypothetical protein
MRTNTNEVPADTNADARNLVGQRRIAREPTGEDQEASMPVSGPIRGTPATKEARSTSKFAPVIALLDREQGITLPEKVEAPGWLSHTARAALTDLKKGHVITKESPEDVTYYRIEKAAEWGAKATSSTPTWLRWRERWPEVRKKPLPRFSAATLRLALAYELQAKVLGRLSRAAQQRLDQVTVAKSETRSASPSMRLIGKWQGRSTWPQSARPERLSGTRKPGVPRARLGEIAPSIRNGMICRSTGRQWEMLAG